jgi:hypothetical protein
MKTKSRWYRGLLVTLDVTLLLIVVGVMALRVVAKVASRMLHCLA